MFKRRVFMRLPVRCPLLDGGAPLFDWQDLGREGCSLLLFAKE